MATLWGVSVAVVFIVLILAVVLACMAAARPSIKKGGGEIGIPRSARDWNMYLAGAGIRNYMWSPRSPADNAPDPPPGVPPPRGQKEIRRRRQHLPAGGRRLLE